VLVHIQTGAGQHNHPFCNTLPVHVGEVEMRWPFGRKTRKLPADSMTAVTLTEDELRECEAYLRSAIPQSEEGAWYMPAEAADSFKRSLVAVCMMGRA
jgi:hypothetical protein